MKRIPQPRRPERRTVHKQAGRRWRGLPATAARRRTRQNTSVHNAIHQNKQKKHFKTERNSNAHGRTGATDCQTRKSDEYKHRTTQSQPHNNVKAMNMASKTNEMSHSTKKAPQERQGGGKGAAGGKMDKVTLTQPKQSSANKTKPHRQQIMHGKAYPHARTQTSPRQAR